MGHKKVVTITLDPEIHQKAFRLSRYHGHRGLSSLIETLLKKWLEEHKNGI